jgi:hypothetical protein
MVIAASSRGLALNSIYRCFLTKATFSSTTLRRYPAGRETIDCVKVICICEKGQSIARGHVLVMNCFEGVGECLWFYVRRDTALPDL